MSKSKNVTKMVARVILLAFISLIVGTMVYNWNARTLTGNSMPMPFGMGMSVVLSGSMEPTLSVDALVFVKKADHYEVGDVVVYQDGHALVIHRLISIDGDQAVTKGDHNNVADNPISVSAIKGKMVGHIPLAGAVVRFFKTPVGSVLLIVAAIALFEIPHRRDRKKATDEQEKIREEIRKLKGE